MGLRAYFPFRRRSAPGPDAPEELSGSADAGPPYPEFASRLAGQIRRLELRARKAVSSDLLGSYRSAFRGTGMVFSDLRPYEPGDDVKHIHWKATARSGKPYVKSYEEERSLRILLIVDTSASLGAFGLRQGSHNKLLEFCGLITVLGTRARDAVGLCLFADTVEQYFPPASRRSHQHRVLHALLSHRPTGKRSDLAAAIRFVQSRERKRTICFIVSDFLCPPFEHELAMLAYRHDVICVLVEHDLDGRLPNAGLVAFEDPETRLRTVVDTGSPAVQRALLQEHRERKQRVMAICNRSGADCVTVKDRVVEPLSQLMHARMKRYR